MIQRARVLAVVLLLLNVLGGTAFAQDLVDDDLVQLDFNDAPLTDIVDAISKMTNKNFIYDERVRGNVTIKSPTAISKEQAYAVFESVLQVKGFTTVETPGGSLKIIPVRDAKETNVETVVGNAKPVNRDRFITRLIPLRYIEAEPIVNTLKPLVSKDANIAAYAATNTVILTESASNIRRILAILEAIDVESYKEELAVLAIEHADASTLATQLSEIYGAEVTSTGSGASSASRRARSSRRSSPARPNQPSPSTGAVKAKVRIITDARTNSLIVLAPSEQLDDVRRLVGRLDVPVSGGGRIHVYYLQHADATDLSQTLASLISGRPAGGPGGGAGQAGGAGAAALRTAVTGLAGGIRVTADPATNSVLIQASKEGYDTISGVIAKLDVERPQVLVEGLIVEVDVTDSESLGFDAVIRFINGNSEFGAVIGGAAGGLLVGGPIGAAAGGAAQTDMGQTITQHLVDTVSGDDPDDRRGQIIDAVISASASNNGINIISAPHVLTMDNEQAEIRIGDNIPIITSRVDAATGAPTLSSSVNVERQDIGVTLRVTPHITEGESLRMEIYQEISTVNTGLVVGNPNDVGVPLSQRTIENTVIIKDGETVVIGGLLSDVYEDNVSKVPFLGDIPVLGWAFKTTSRTLRKVNLLIFLTPHIIRSPADMELETVIKREEFADASQDGLGWSDRERAVDQKRQKEAIAAGEDYEPRGQNPARIRVLDHEARYPAERIEEITVEQSAEYARLEAERVAAERAPYYMVAALMSGDEEEAMDALQIVIDGGQDGTLVSTSLNGGVAFELRVGPYTTIERAQDVQRVVGRTLHLQPTILVVPNPDRPSGAAQ